MSITIATRTDLIIVSFNSRRYLANCIQSVIEHTPPNHYQIQVVDNASTDGSRELLQAYSQVRTIFNRSNRGYACACNQGITAGQGEYIFLLNSDLQVTPNWLAPLLNQLANPRTAVVGPKLVNTHGCLVGAGVIGTNAHPVIRGWRQPDRADLYHQTREVLSLCGACLGIKRQLLQQLGLLDENYFHYFEETDYCYNARFHGYQVVYCPESVVVHHGQGSCHDHAQLNRYYQASRAYFVKKWAEFLPDPTEYG
jgi:GT2 family glycosyltransferase